jgi:hypothetical protein
MEGAPPVANQIDLFMHFLGASRDGLVARRVDLDTISSSEWLLPCNYSINRPHHVRCPTLRHVLWSLRLSYTLPTPAGVSHSERFLPAGALSELF